jgi:NRPS condensation-like uncharacterized protein
MSSSSHDIGELSPEQRALLMLRLKKKSTAQGRSAPRSPQRIRRASREAPLPLSFAQQRLWFLHQLDRRDPSYNMPHAFSLSGPLDVAVLVRTLNEITRRQEALRTSFPVTEGKPFQVISPAQPAALSTVDLRELSAQASASEVERLAAADARHPFNLESGPLMRSTLLKLADEEHILLFTMHHIISDGWSITILIQEVKALYKSFSEGSESTLPELPLQYADFAQWQRQWLEGEELESQLAYWKKQLKGIPARLELPTDRQRPKAQTNRGEQQNFVVSREMTKDLKAFSQREGVTLFMTLLAAFQTLLHRSTGQEDIVVGTPVAGRNQVETEHLIGFFINTLALRTDLSGNPTFRELLGRVREMTLSAYVNQDIPFEKIVEEIRPERSLSYAPIFQVLFALHNVPASTLEVSGLTLKYVTSSHKTTKFELALYMDEIDGEIFSLFQYSADLFEPSTIYRMQQQFVVLLESILEDSGRRLSNLQISTPAERRQLMADFNDDF